MLKAGEERREEAPEQEANVAEDMPVFSDRPLYGASLAARPLAPGPTNESGVMHVFGLIVAGLGFVVLRIQTEFPDCEDMRQVKDDRWQRARIEFEFESRNFLKHLHRADERDLIVCWTHNWPECPLEVVELQKLMGSGLPTSGLLSSDPKSGKAGSGVGLYGHLLKTQFVLILGKHIPGDRAIRGGRIAQLSIEAGFNRDHSEWPFFVEVDANG